MNSHPYTNHLIHESSPYLLQHAHNPVNWYPWSDEAWEKARKENKPVLISIGYSSCHWCHVMERESFENTFTAQLMNAHFICIKVDREERPDVDDVYMSAVQLMSGTGGWPLNCFTLPDGRPIYGGTYFPNETWNSVLMQLADFYRDQPEKARSYADELMKGMHTLEPVHIENENTTFHRNLVKEMIHNWKTLFDKKEGGSNRSPKFPMPDNYEFLLQYGLLSGDSEVLDHVKLTLNKMALGGIFDQVGGGFSRYSVDSHWKVPHFEKMLYDNAQLVSLYSMGYMSFKDPVYKEVIEKTISWLKREMRSPEGAYYSALDADSEGKEGKYYVWQKEEIQKLISGTLNGKGFGVFADYYTINSTGLWENGNYILLRKRSDKEVAESHNMAVEDLKAFISTADKVLLEARNKRIPPGLDDKIITSWNGMMIQGLCHAYSATGRKEYLNDAIRCANFLIKNLHRSDGGLYHVYKSGKASINGYLDDYAFLSEGCIALYTVTFDEQWLMEARALCDYALRHFSDPGNPLPWFTSDLDPPLIIRKKERMDDVIPSSCATMANVLFKLGTYFDDTTRSSLASQMLKQVLDDMPRYAPGYSSWGQLLLHYTFPFREVVFAGTEALTRLNKFTLDFYPNILLAGNGRPGSNVPLLESRWVEGKTLIYVCENRACKLPVEDIQDAVALLKEAR